jgi:hypothetical protein
MLGDDSIDVGFDVKKPKLGINDFFFKDDPLANPKKKVKVMTDEEKQKYQEKLRKIPDMLGKENFNRLQRHKEELDTLRQELEFLEK